MQHLCLVNTETQSSALGWSVLQPMSPPLVVIRNKTFKSKHKVVALCSGTRWGGPQGDAPGLRCIQL